VGKNQKMPNSNDIAKELSDFLSKKFGAQVKIVPSVLLPDETTPEVKPPPKKQETKINFSIKPEELVEHLDQYIIKQDKAKSILATKICTHFNRISYMKEKSLDFNDMVGRIKNNVLILGPTGVGKTYMIKLIAKKIGVPFVKGDATKFSETGYVGGDVEDLVRDLLREADDNLELAQFGIVYIDEIDKIASSNNSFGHDISRAGVQRALLKPMEDTDIELKVAHDPISIMEDIDHYRKTGKKQKRVINTKNILFIMSGAFSEITKIIKERITQNHMGFSANIVSQKDDNAFLKKVKSEDLINFGFESEFIGRLPVNAVLEPLEENDLYLILKNPNNPTILGKKLDFFSYGININFEDKALRLLAKFAYSEKTGARGLVSAIENAILDFEKKLPSTNIEKFSVTEEVINYPEKVLNELIENPHHSKWVEIFDRISKEEEEWIIQFLKDNITRFNKRYNFKLNSEKINMAASIYSSNIMDIDKVLDKIKDTYDQVKKIEQYYSDTHGVKVNLTEDAMDYIIDQHINGSVGLDAFYKKLNKDFEYGLKLIREKTGITNFDISLESLLDSDSYLENMIRKEFRFQDEKKETIEDKTETKIIEEK